MKTIDATTDLRLHLRHALGLLDVALDHGRALHRTGCNCVEMGKPCFSCEVREAILFGNQTLERTSGEDSKTGFQDMGPDAVRRSGDVTVAMREVAVGTVECAISRPGKERVVRARLLVTVKDTLDCGSDPYWDAAARSAISEADNLDQSWGGAAEWEKSKGREDVDDRWRVTR